MNNHETALAVAHIAANIDGHLSTANLTLQLDTGKGFKYASSVILDVCVEGEPKVKAKVITGSGKSTVIWVGQDFNADAAHRILKGLLDG